MNLEDMEFDLVNDIDSDIDDVFDAQLLRKELSETRKKYAVIIRNIRSAYREKQMDLIQSYKQKVSDLEKEHKDKTKDLDRARNNIANADRNISKLIDSLRDVDHNVAKYSEKQYEDNYKNGYDQGRSDGSELVYQEFEDKVLDSKGIDKLVDRVNSLHIRGDENPYKTVLLELAIKAGHIKVLSEEY